MPFRLEFAGFYLDGGRVHPPHAYPWDHAPGYLFLVFETEADALEWLAEHKRGGEPPARFVVREW